MMAGTGVSVGGGAGMLRTRRRDVSVKPNRKLDRKSSRGMIYENEELRLRTIHINAEVEQGQNDIKKLRRENEQLRREIWSLRDEYDKLEEILKRQKSRGESEEYEDRSEEDEDERSEYSCEEDEAVEEEEDARSTKDDDQEERLENAENQKISSEKMNSNNPHRLHVDFDDLSVVEEEEELKKDREKKDNEEKQRQKNDGRLRRQLQDNFPFYPSSYDPPSAFSASTFYPECPFEFPSATNASTLLSCPGLYSDTFLPRADPETGNPTPNRSVIDACPDPALPVVHMPPLGWQTNVILPKEQLRNCSPLEPNFPSSPVTRIPRVDTPDLRTPLENQSKVQGYGSAAGSSVLSKVPNLLQRRNVVLRQPMKFPTTNPFKESRMQSPFAEGQALANVWRVGGMSGEERNTLDGQENAESGLTSQETSLLAASEKPKHFFAPLPSKVKSQKAEEQSPEIGAQQFGTTNSSSSGKTDSTVICRDKGSVDVCVNGAIPYQTEPLMGRDDQRTFLSTENLLIEDARPGLSETQLTKSLSCQDLTLDCQGQHLKTNGKPQALTKSDNTLDNIANGGDSSRPYKSHLNVTLRIPGRAQQSSSPEIPEIPELPSMDYRLLRNPFLRNYVDAPAAKPLSVQVNETNPTYQYPNPASMSTYGRGIHKAVGPSEQNRLLIPTDQLVNSKLLSPLAKQDIQVTSFERPSPHTLIPPATPYDLETLRRITTNRFLASQNLYQNLPFVPGRPYACPAAANPRLYYENNRTKVPAQTQTSLDGDSHQEDEPNGNRQIESNASEVETPSGQRKKKATKKAKGSSKDPSALSPAAQRRLKKQASTTSGEGSIPESPGKPARPKSRKSSIAENAEDKNESRSSSSGQDSPRKEQTRRVSIYFNAKKRPSLTSVRTTRSGSLDISRDKYARDALDGGQQQTAEGERERTNSVSSRDNGSAKARKTSTSSGNVPWCACWGNGCV